ncbi:hypothetical protein MKW92_010123 [Papaver armeniacum]|nr:hypothetical protein MKW92_010123 [Papaver armeniacum]
MTKLHQRVDTGFGRIYEVYVGIKTVVGDKKFVIGTRVCMQPNIKPSIHSSRHKPSRKARIRKEWIYVMKRDKDKKILFHPLPHVPKEYSEALGFGSIVLGGCHLHLFGGKYPLKGLIRGVIFYSARKNKRHRAPVMLPKKKKSEGVHRSLKSDEVYDSNKNMCSFISNMETIMVPLIGVVHNGKWFLKGLVKRRGYPNIPQSKTFPPIIYHPETDSYNSVYNGVVAGWRNPSISTNVNLHALDRKDGYILRIYDVSTDTLGNHMDSKLHLVSSRALEAAVLIQLNRKVCIIRNNMSISMANLSNADNSRCVMSDHSWETIAGKEQFKTFITNIWSSFASRNRIKVHLLHCQMLQA